MLERIPGFLVRAGRLPGLDLPAIGDHGGLAAWRAHLGKSEGYYLRFDGTLPLREVARLSRLGELWVDCGPLAAEDAVDLASSGAARIVVPIAKAEALADAIGWNLAFAWDPAAMPAPKALALAAACDAPLITDTAVACDVGVADVFLRTFGPEPWRITLERIVAGPADPRDVSVEKPEAPEQTWTDL